MIRDNFSISNVKPNINKGVEDKKISQTSSGDMNKMTGNTKSETSSSVLIKSELISNTSHI